MKSTSVPANDQEAIVSANTTEVARLLIKIIMLSSNQRCRLEFAALREWITRCFTMPIECPPPNGLSLNTVANVVKNLTKTSRKLVNLPFFANYCRIYPQPRSHFPARGPRKMVAILDLTSIRVGNEEYVRVNRSYGLKTLRTRHVTCKNGRVDLRFRAKGGVQREVVIEDKRLVRLVRQLKRLPGAHLFQYRDEEGAIHRVDSLQVNEYLREATGEETITAKDFRTWKASSLAAELLYEERWADTSKERKRVINQVVANVAETLGNTPAACRNSYIHPGLLVSYEAGEFGDYFQGFSANRYNQLRRQE